MICWVGTEAVEATEDDAGMVEEVTSDAEATASLVIAGCVETKLTFAATVGAAVDVGEAGS